MTLTEALFNVSISTGLAISRPYLMDERHSYLTYENEHTPLKQRWTHSPTLTIDWHPSPVELMAEDWALVNDPRLSQ